MKILKTAAALPLLIGLLGAAQHPASNPAAPRNGAGVSTADKAAAKAAHLTPEELVAKIHALDAMEIRMGRLAQKKSRDPDVRRFGLLLERDHKVSDSKLQEFARQTGIPMGVYKPDADDRAMEKQLSSLDGSAFDAAFVEHMKMGHEKAVKALSAARLSTTNPKLSDFVGRLLPILTQHDRLAGKLQGKKLG